jgi:hypothetical protein
MAAMADAALALVRALAVGTGAPRPLLDALAALAPQIDPPSAQQVVSSVSYLLPLLLPLLPSCTALTIGSCRRC